MKKKNKKIFVGALATLLILGGASTVIGVASDGFKNWDTSTWFQDEFKDVKIESMTVGHDGAKKDLTIVVPKEATYTTVIKKGGEIVTECIEIGTYDYEVTVKIGDKTKTYKAQLNIVENSQVSINGLSNIKKLKVDETTYKLTATITPNETTNKKVEWSLNFKNPSSPWASGKNVNDYISISGTETSTCTIKLNKRFNEQVIVKAKTTDGTNLEASCTIDCKKLLTSVSSSPIEVDDSIKKFNNMRNNMGEEGFGFVVSSFNQSLTNSYSWNSLVQNQNTYSEGTIDISDSIRTSYSVDFISDFNEIKTLFEKFVIINNEGIQLTSAVANMSDITQFNDYMNNYGENGQYGEYTADIGTLNIDSNGVKSSIYLTMHTFNIYANNIGLDHTGITFE